MLSSKPQDAAPNLSASPGRKKKGGLSLLKTKKIPIEERKRNLAAELSKPTASAPKLETSGQITPKLETISSNFTQPQVLKNDYFHILSMYKQPPKDIISLEKLEQLALSRYKILLAMDSLAAVSAKFTPDWTERLTKRLYEIDAKFTSNDINLGSFLSEDSVRNDRWIKNDYYADILNDHWSHTILKLAYSRSEELKNWFLEHECDLFKYRISRQVTLSGALCLTNFMHNEKIKIEKAETSEVPVEYRTVTTVNLSVDRKQTIVETEYFKVDWITVLPLVSKRRVFIKDGFAYVAKSNLPVILTDIYRSSLQRQLALGQKHWSSGALLDEQDRLVPLLKYFSQQNTENYVSDNKDGTLTAQNIEEVSNLSFPLCIHTMYKSWRKEHHMKHFSRLAFWRFLKSAGLSMEDCLKIFKQESTKYPNGQKQFEKEFMYNIRHAYGKEGKRADYTGFSCQKMINENIASGDCHGCPYKYSNEEELAAKLKQYGGVKNTDEIKQILNLSKNQHYQLACAKQFYFKHTSIQNKDIKNKLEQVIDIEDIASGIVSPNQYFDKSYKLIKGEIGKKKVESGIKSENSDTVVIHTKWKTKEELEATRLKDEDFEIDDFEDQIGEELEEKSEKSEKNESDHEKEETVEENQPTDVENPKQQESDAPGKEEDPEDKEDPSRESKDDEMIVKDEESEDEMQV